MVKVIAFMFSVLFVLIPSSDGSVILLQY
jgi:hypothetical protein